MAVGQGEADVVGQRPEVGGMVVEPFQFDQQRAEPVHLVWNSDPESVLDG